MRIKVLLMVAILAGCQSIGNRMCLLDVDKSGGIKRYTRPIMLERDDVGRLCRWSSRGCIWRSIGVGYYATGDQEALQHEIDHWMYDTSRHVRSTTCAAKGGESK